MQDSKAQHNNTQQHSTAQHSEIEPKMTAAASRERACIVCEQPTAPIRTCTCHEQLTGATANKAGVHFKPALTSRYHTPPGTRTSVCTGCEGNVSLRAICVCDPFFSNLYISYR